MYNRAMGYVSVSCVSYICSDLQTREHTIFPGFSLCGFPARSVKSTTFLYITIVTVKPNRPKKNLKKYIRINLFILNDNSIRFHERKMHVHLAHHVTVYFL